MGTTMKAFDAYCARLNDGLAAVALVLALATAAAVIVRDPEIYQIGVDAETGLPADVTPVVP
jgi:hypothetical protein